MKNINFYFAVMCVMFINNSFSQSILDDSIFIYDEYNNKEWHFVKKDIYYFKLINNEKYSKQDGGIVDTVIQWQGVSSKFNEIHFKKSSNLQERAQFIKELQKQNNFIIGSFALSKTIEETNGNNLQYFPTDDRILITFEDVKVDEKVISEFSNKYNLELVYSPNPSLPQNLRWSYTFRLNPLDKELTTVKLSQIIIEQENGVVKYAEPNIYSVIPLGCVEVSELNTVYNGHFSNWHIRNTGLELIWNNQYGTNDADADICECWGEGYTGKNIKVGVIDFGGVEFSHPDFDANKIHPAYNARDNIIISSDFDLMQNTTPRNLYSIMQ